MFLPRSRYLRLRSSIGLQASSLANGRMSGVATRSVAANAISRSVSCPRACHFAHGSTPRRLRPSSGCLLHVSSGLAIRIVRVMSSLTCMVFSFWEPVLQGGTSVASDIPSGDGPRLRCRQSRIGLSAAGLSCCRPDWSRSDFARTIQSAAAMGAGLYVSRSDHWRDLPCAFFRRRDQHPCSRRAIWFSLTGVRARQYSDWIHAMGKRARGHQPRMDAPAS